jgi:hypothetical protein
MDGYGIDPVAAVTFVLKFVTACLVAGLLAVILWHMIRIIIKSAMAAGAVVGVAIVGILAMFFALNIAGLSTDFGNAIKKHQNEKPSVTTILGMDFYQAGEKLTLN